MIILPNVSASNNNNNVACKFQCFWIFSMYWVTEVTVKNTASFG